MQSLLTYNPFYVTCAPPPRACLQVCHTVASHPVFITMRRRDKALPLYPASLSPTESIAPFPHHTFPPGLTQPQSPIALSLRPAACQLDRKTSVVAPSQYLGNLTCHGESGASHSSPALGQGRDNRERSPRKLQRPRSMSISATSVGRAGQRQR